MVEQILETPPARTSVDFPVVHLAAGRYRRLPHADPARNGQDPVLDRQTLAGVTKVSGLLLAAYVGLQDKSAAWARPRIKNPDAL